MNIFNTTKFIGVEELDMNLSIEVSKEKDLLLFDDTFKQALQSI